MVEARVEFCSPGWFALLRGVLAACAPNTRAVLGDSPFTIQETYLDGPSGAVTWRCTLQAGEVIAFDHDPVDEPDLGSRSPFAVAWRRASTVVSNDPAEQAAYAALGADRVERIMNCPVEVATGLAAGLGHLHNELARQTLPPPGPPA